MPSSEYVPPVHMPKKTVHQAGVHDLSRITESHIEKIPCWNDSSAQHLREPASDMGECRHDSVALRPSLDGTTIDDLLRFLNAGSTMATFAAQKVCGPR